MVLTEEDLGRREEGIGGAGLKLCPDLEISSPASTPGLSKMNRSSWEPELGELESCCCVA